MNQGGKNTMLSTNEIHAILQADVDRTGDDYRARAAEFRAAVADVPSHIPGSDASLFVKQASQKQANAIQAYCEAVERFNAFVLRGEVPHDLMN
jgi:hypothetical protein